MERSPPNARIALIGNPNTGKTSLFNALTGMKQRVGNYPGVTVDKKTGDWKLTDGQTVELIDLPGTYSLVAKSLDERIAVDALSGHIDGQQAPDLAIVVVDVENLERNLFLASQVAELDVPMMIALNCWDVAERKGLQIDCKLLEQRLGIPVVPTVATRKRGSDELAAAAGKALENRPMMVRPAWPGAVTESIELLRDNLLGSDGKPLSDGEWQRLLFDRDSAVRGRLQQPAEVHEPIIEQAREKLRHGGYNPDAAEALLRHRFLHPLLVDIMERQATQRFRSRSESVDQLLLHRVWGLGVFIGMMYLVFQSVYTWAGPFMSAIEAVIGWGQDIATGALMGTPMMQSLVVDGVIGGVGAFLVFLPQILILFLFIALLEETGYMARAAFLMDKMFQWCGLNGKSFVPLLSSYACAIPGIMATRTIHDSKARLITILIAPLMSCSARLPVYVLFIGAFVEPRYGPNIAGATLFAMHFVGAATAAPLAWLLNCSLNRNRSPKPFLMELPSYRVPRIKTVSWRVFESGRDFVSRAGTIIFAMTVIIWALLYFPRPENVPVETAKERGYEFSADNPTAREIEMINERYEKEINAAYLEQSFLGRFGQFAQPVFAPAGYDWKITVGVLASFPAREVIISTLGITYALGGEVDEESGDLRQTLTHTNWESGPRKGAPVFNLAVALSIMVFFALCMQCGATVAVIARELNWGWALASFFGLTAIAWVAAVITYQVTIRLI